MKKQKQSATDSDDETNGTEWFDEKEKASLLLLQLGSYLQSFMSSLPPAFKSDFARHNSSMSRTRVLFSGSECNWTNQKKTIDKTGNFN